jgi:hypothetical protein
MKLIVVVFVNNPCFGVDPDVFVPLFIVLLDCTMEFPVGVKYTLLLDWLLVFYSILSRQRMGVVESR